MMMLLVLLLLLEREIARAPREADDEDEEVEEDEDAGGCGLAGRNRDLLYDACGPLSAGRLLNAGAGVSCGCGREGGRRAVTGGRTNSSHSSKPA